MSVHFYQSIRRRMPADRSLYTINTHTSWCVDSCLQRITSVPLAHVLEEDLKVCGHNILQLWMKSPVNLAVSCVQRTAKVARPVLRFPSIVVVVRNVWELHANQHFQNWRPWHCDTRFCLRAKHIDGETGGAYGTSWNKRNMRTGFCYKKQGKNAALWT